MEASRWFRCQFPAAGFVGGPTNGAAPLDGDLYESFELCHQLCSWNFGDGIMLNTSSNTNVTDIYMNAGNYTVILTAIGWEAQTL